MPGKFVWWLAWLLFCPLIGLGSVGRLSITVLAVLILALFFNGLFWNRHQEFMEACEKRGNEPDACWEMLR